VLALVLALSALTGCARLALTLSEDPLADFRQAREEDDYDRALYIAEHLDPENKAHEPIREALPELRAEIERFEEDTIEAAEQLADRGHWDQVWQRLGQAMDQWRASPALRKAERQLRAREERESRVARTELLLAEARWRLSTMDLADRLSRFTLTRTHHQFQRWRQDNRALARELVTQGRWFAERDDWQRAHACLNNARALHAEAVPESLLAKAQDKVSAASRRSRANQARAARAQAREKHEQARAMLASYLNTGKLSQLLELRRFLGEHDNVGFPAELTARVEIVSRERFRTGMTEGDAHYARGEYRDARAIWRRIEPLAPPGSELSKKLERVQRVIDKLENLENR
jgi:hypothetical protein